MVLTSEGLVSAVLRIVPLTRWPECAGWLEWLVVDCELSGSPDVILWWWRKPPASWTCCCWLWWATAATAMCLSSIVEPMVLLLPPRDPDPFTPPTLPPLLMPPMPPPTPLVLLLFLCFLYFTLRMKRTENGVKLIVVIVGRRRRKQSRFINARIRFSLFSISLLLLFERKVCIYVFLYLYYILFITSDELNVGFNILMIIEIINLNLYILLFIVYLWIII